jgi:hypothetical protein
MSQSQSSKFDFDERMFSSTNLPYRYPCLVEGHELQVVIPAWAAQCLQAYNNTAGVSQPRVRPTTKTITTTTTTTTKQLPRGPEPHYPQTTRRHRQRTKAPSATAAAALSLACPFYKRNPERHHACAWTVALRSVRSAKQHVIVHHHAPIYCPICTTHFPSAVSRDRHVRARACVRREPPPGSLEGATEDQVDRLLRRDTVAGEGAGANGAAAGRSPRRRRGYLVHRPHPRPRLVKKGDKEQESWFHMWDVLFPGVGRPETTYLASPRERKIVALRRFWRKVGPGMVKRLLAPCRADLATREAAAGSVLRDMVQQAGLTGY